MVYPVYFWPDSRNPDKIPHLESLKNNEGTSNSSDVLSHCMWIKHFKEPRGFPLVAQTTLT